MRRGMIVLAICGLLTGPLLQAADDPFDFSSPLETNPPRPAQFFSRASTEDPADAAGATDSEQSAYRRAKRPTSAELLGEKSPAAAVDRPQTVSFGQEMARERGGKAHPRPQSTPQPEPRETLQRFDEFLRSRDVVSAKYNESTERAGMSAIRQVQMEDDLDDLPEFGDLNGNDSASKSQKPVEQPQSLLLGNELRPVATPSGDRLTDPITTSPFANAPKSATPTSEPTAEMLFGSPVAEEPQKIPQRPSAQQLLNVNTIEEYTVPAASPVPRTIDHAAAVPAATAPAIAAAWKLLTPMNVGQECHAELTLTNTGEAPADRVSLEVRLPQAVQVISTNPAPVEQRDFLGWKLSGLAGGATSTIDIVFVATQPGPVDFGTFVRHTSAGHDTFTVAEPKLELAVSGPNQVNLGEPASQMLVVRNPGTGVATHVTIEANIPKGLEHSTGEERLQMDIGSLNPGEVRSVRLAMGAVTGGNHIVQVQATADSGLVQTAAAEVNVIAPSLRTAIAGPSLRYVGREAEYTIRVLNDGSAATDFVQVNHRIPEGFDFVRADRGAKFDPTTRVLNWYVGQLENGKAADLKLTLLATAAGDFEHFVRATSDVGAQADAQLSTRVQGAASLVVKVADLDDPVEVGRETAYEITVTNEGTASAHGIALACELPQGMAFAKAEGASEHRLQNEVIGFRPVDELPAGKSLTYRVFVKGAVAGDHRFRCRLTSESLEQPLFTEELTKFYGE